MIRVNYTAYIYEGVNHGFHNDTTPRYERSLITGPRTYTDTAGFTGHVFALFHLLGFRFAPRIRDLTDRRIYVPEKPSAYPAIAGLVGGTLNTALMAARWKEVQGELVRKMKRMEKIKKKVARRAPFGSPAAPATR